MKKLLLFIVIFLYVGIGTGFAQLTVLHSFNGADGKYPKYTNLVLSGNMLYGMTYEGGAHDSGCIFSMHTDGTGYTVIHDFHDTDGKFPCGSLTLSGNVLYGMTSGGGKNADGVIFSVTTNGTGYNIIHNFNGTDGKSPYGSLTLLGNILYGMTYAGGKNSGGVIFSINTNGNGYTDIYDFNNTTGKFPYGSLTISGNVLYGMASYGGTNLSGVIFSVNTNGTGYDTLYNFHGVGDGLTPYGSLILSGNVLYGMTYGGGPAYVGNIFSINTNGTGYLNLLWFSGEIGKDIGKYPFGDLVLSASGSVLYGMTSSVDAEGNIFSVNINGTGYNDLLNFTATNGIKPQGSLTPSVTGDTLLGMTSMGGNGYGTIFRFTDIGLGINDISTTIASIHVYPNPSNGIFRLAFSHRELVSGPPTVEIYNVLGAKVYDGMLKQVQHDYELNLSSQPNGVYLYRVTTETGDLVGEGKVVIQR